MDLSQILTLAAAGYSKADIEGLIGSSPAAAVTAQPQEADTEPVKTEPEPTPKPAAKPAEPNTNDVLSAIKELTAAIQAGNLRRAEYAGPADDDVNSILAEVIAPTGARRK